MNLTEPIELHDLEKTIILPLSNLIRLALVHIHRLKKEYVEAHGEVTDEEFMNILLKELGLGEGVAVLK